MASFKFLFSPNPDQSQLGQDETRSLLEPVFGVALGTKQSALHRLLSVHFKGLHFRVLLLFLLLLRCVGEEPTLQSTPIQLLLVTHRSRIEMRDNTPRRGFHTRADLAEHLVANFLQEPGSGQRWRALEWCRLRRASVLNLSPP